VHVGVTFAGAEDLLRWERSAERRRRLAEVDGLTEGGPVARSVDDLARWGLGSAPQPAAPTRLRLAILIWVALFPPATLLNALVLPRVADWPVVARTLLLTVVMVPIVVFVTLPLVNRAVAACRRRAR
jgi:uncharacterized protein